MGLRFNPAPGWPPPPPGFVPPPHWQPDPSWPPAPPGWQLWVDDSAPDPAPASWGGAPAAGGFAGVRGRPDGFGGGPADGPPWTDDFGTGAAGAPWDDLAGPEPGLLSGAPTQAYPAGTTGPQVPYAGHDPFGPPGPFDPQDSFGPQDPFTRQSTGHGGPGRRAAAPGKANGLAVASLVLGAIGVTIIGAIASVVLGIRALGQIRRTGQRGRGLAIGGLVCSAVWLVVIGAYLMLPGGSPSQPSASGGHSSSPAPGPSSPASHGSPSTNVFSLRPGQCFQNPPASQTVLGVTYVTVVSCSTPHNAQVFTQFNATGTGYPGVRALKRQADSRCHAQVAKTVQASKIKNSMTLHYLYPLEASWSTGHRTITCLVVAAKSNLTTSLLRSHPAH